VIETQTEALKALKEDRKERERIRNSLIDLYLSVKVRPKLEVSQY